MTRKGLQFAGIAAVMGALALLAGCASLGGGLNARTLDEVFIGDPESELEHLFEGNNSRSGVYEDEHWRDAQGEGGGYYQYTFSTGGNENLALWVRYWGNDNMERTFDILIDETPLVRENIVDKWSVEDFVSQEYPIPPDLVRGKDAITVKFQSAGNSIAGGIYGLRLLKGK